MENTNEKALEYIKAILNGFNDIEQMGVVRLGENIDVEMFFRATLAKGVISKGVYIYIYCNRIYSTDSRYLTEDVTLMSEDNTPIYLYNLYL